MEKGISLVASFEKSIILQQFDALACDRDVVNALRSCAPMCKQPSVDVIRYSCNNKTSRLQHVFWASIHWADRRRAAISREVSKLRDSGLYFSSHYEFNRHLGWSAAEMPSRFQSDTVIMKSNLAVSRLHEVLRKAVLLLSEYRPWRLASRFKELTVTTRLLTLSVSNILFADMGIPLKHETVWWPHREMLCAAWHLHRNATTVISAYTWAEWAHATILLNLPPATVAGFLSYLYREILLLLTNNGISFGITVSAIGPDAKQWANPICNLENISSDIHEAVWNLTKLPEALISPWSLAIIASLRIFEMMLVTLKWRHTERNGVSNHQPHYCLLNRIFTRKSNKTSKLRVTGLREGNSPVTGKFPAQRSSNAENVAIWWRHHDRSFYL